MIEEITTALSRVKDPELHRSITELEMVDSISFDKGVVTLRVLLTIAGCPMKDRLESDITSAVAALPGVTSVDLTFGAMTQEQRDKVKAIMRNGRERHITFAQPDSLTRVIAIASGKGGVGKSSITANLAVAAAQRGFKVGILDGDVYGHSIPRLMGIVGQRPTALDQSFIPITAHGVKVVSMEMFKPERDDAVAYRGPLLHRVLEQLLADAFWGDLDFLFLDLPPGTGDLAISLGQMIPNSEIIVVTTPQLAAAEVAERAGRIGHAMHQQILGVIENMSGVTCAACGEVTHLFGNGGGEETARKLSTLVGADIALLGKVPFNPELREGGDHGIPLVLSHPESAAALAINEIIEKVAKRGKSLLGVRLGLAT